MKNKYQAIRAIKGSYFDRREYPRIAKETNNPVESIKELAQELLNRRIENKFNWNY